MTPPRVELTTIMMCKQSTKAVLIVPPDGIQVPFSQSGNVFTRQSGLGSRY
jgi:hypothetical protein